MHALVVLASCFTGAPEHTPKLDGPPRPRVDVPVEGPAPHDPRVTRADSGDTADTADTGEGPLDPPYACPPPDAPVEPTCDLRVERTTPADRERDVDVGTTATFWVATADPTARAVIDGVAGRTRIDGLTVEFTPDAPLAPDTHHTARLCACGSESTFAFTTGFPLGTPVPEPADLVGRTWSLDLAAGRLRQPVGLDALFAPHLREPVLLQVIDAPPATLSLRSGWGAVDAAGQDGCAPTADLTTDFAHNPTLTAGPAAGGFPNLAPTRAEDVTVTGTWTTDGEHLARATWSGRVDTAPWDALSEPGDPGSFCAALAPLGGACEPCADGAPTCLRLIFDGLEGREVTPMALSPVDEPCD